MKLSLLMAVHNEAASTDGSRVFGSHPAHSFWSVVGNKLLTTWPASVGAPWILTESA